jgi:hypothetical protein
MGSRDFFSLSFKRVSYKLIGCCCFFLIFFPFLNKLSTYLRFSATQSGAGAVSLLSSCSSLFLTNNVSRRLEALGAVGALGGASDQHALSAVLEVHSLQLGDKAIWALGRAKGTEGIN